MKTLGISPKVWQPALGTFLLGAIVVFSSYASSGNFNSSELITAGATLASVLVTALFGYTAKPGDVVPDRNSVRAS